MNNEQCSANTLPKLENKCCNLEASVKQVLYDPETGNVMDYDKNIIGKGRFMGGIFIVEPFARPLP